MKIIDVKVTLAHFKPEISRDLQVPVDLTLDLFHDTIQYAMGWEHDHMYSFEIGRKVWMDSMGEESFGEESSVSDCKLSDLLELKEVKKLVYIYDMGDYWTHVFKFGKQTDAVAGELYPRLIGGTGACPPEDCGGIGGYEEIIEELAKPEKERDEEIVDWVGEDFDPNQFDLASHQKSVLLVADHFKKSA